ncbi:lipopolysaccharide biosynthesis protein [Flavivirga algicola]|uniref:Lipopolysaccharide biosynthesis protein n=1 Tax=Flavivirga algicola TaxID=2729136 RepID=A0ABX1S291_9FLAO|nr:lipopolysaccharide biosynthesis protein [Flavivirga algicola]NMH89333.1 lipopolysaccharide biosynthesis protein [Flavivirga algicola]
MSLKRKTVDGVLWSGLEKFTTLFIQLISTLIIARVISPVDFGLIGMLAVFMAVAQIILDSGFGQALIRKKDATNRDYSSVFYLNIVLGIILYTIFYFSSPFIAYFFNEPDLELISKIAFIIIPINALGLIQFTILNKDLNFKKLSKVAILSAFISGVLGVTIAFYCMNVWALVAQSIFFYFLRTVFLWVFSSWRPIRKFSIDSIKEMYSFSLNLLLTGLIGSIFNNLYSVVIGKVYSPIDLGYFSQADRFQKIPSTSITGVIQSVTFPILSKVQNQDQRLRKGYLKIIGVAFFIIAPIMMFLMIISESLFDILLTSKWHTASIYFKYFCIIGALYPLSSINLNILNIKGKGKLILKLEIFRKLLLCLILAVTFQISMMALMYGSVLYSICQLILNSYFSGKQISLSLKRQLLNLSPIVIAVLPAIGITIILNMFSNDIHKLVLMLFQFVIFFGIYVYMSRKLKIKYFYDFITICKEKLELIKPIVSK